MTADATRSPQTAAWATTTGTTSTAASMDTVSMSDLRASAVGCSSSAAHPDQGDTDSDVDVYGQKYIPSTESLGGPPRMGPSESSTPTFMDHGAREPYPAWSTERQIPLSKEEIEDIFLDLTQKFGFQRDSMRNMVRVCLPSSAKLPGDPRFNGI